MSNETTDTTTTNGAEIPDATRGYQVAAQIRQLLAERANAVAYRNTTRIHAVDKQLTELGYQPDAATPEVTRQAPPIERSARADKTLKAGTVPAATGR